MRFRATISVSRVLLPAIAVLLLTTLSIAQDLTLPTYHLTISEAYLTRLRTNPLAITAYPASISFDSVEYAVHVRYRGSSARRLPKPSWRIEFDDRHPGNLQKINLDAEYYDRSLMRDYLSNKLAEMIGLPVPEMRYVSLKVNNRFYGVYLEVEPVNAEFVERRNLGNGPLFFSVGHQGRFAPFLKDAQFRQSYDLQEGTGSDYDSLGQLLMLIGFGSEEVVEDELERRVDCENVVQYFALQYVIGNWDGFAKNQHVLKAGDGRTILMPWDCDATLGNDWQGNWTNDNSRLHFNLLHQNALFRRVVEREEFRIRFQEIVLESAETYLPAILNSLPDLFETVRHDVHLDPMKRAANAEFDEEEEKLREYITARSENLPQVRDYFQVMHQPEIEFSTQYVARQDEEITLRITPADHPESVTLCVVDSAGTEAYFATSDAGELGDEQSGDGVFTTVLNRPELRYPYYLSIWVYNAMEEGYPFPRSGWFQQKFFPLSGPQIRLDPEPPSEGDISSIGSEEILESNTFLLGFQNVSGRQVNLSGCRIGIGRSHKRITLPEGAVLSEEDSIWVTNHLDLARSACPNWIIFGGFYFKPDEGDTIFLTNVAAEVVTAMIFEEPIVIEEPASSVVINEINYHSSEDFNAGDWIELYNRGEEVDLGSWRLLDARSDHVYTIPAGTHLEQGMYLIIAEDTVRFKAKFGWPGRVLGNLDYSFANGSDDVRLYDRSGVLVDWVAYDDSTPWPSEADGRGSTLELNSPESSNYNWYHWSASAQPAMHGSPGAPSGTIPEGVEQTFPSISYKHELLAAYPNPFNGSLKLEFSSFPNRNCSIFILNLLGRHIANLDARTNLEGKASIIWSVPGGIPSGVYYIALAGSSELRARPILLVK